MLLWITSNSLSGRIIGIALHIHRQQVATLLRSTGPVSQIKTKKHPMFSAASK